MSQLPAHIKSRMAEQSSTADDIASAGNATIPRLSIKNGKFRFVIGEDESKKMNSVEVAVVGVDPQGGRMMKSYYAQAYDPANPAPPDCSSTNGMFPDAWVQNPVSDSCLKCPKNAFGTGVNAQGQATKGKACKDSKWLWVVPLEELAEESPQYYALSVPAMSLKALSAYGREVKKLGVPLHLLKTVITDDDEFDFVAIKFEQDGFLDEAQCDKSTEMNNEKPWVELIGDTSDLTNHRAHTPVAHKTAAVADQSQVQAAEKAPIEAEKPPFEADKPVKDVNTEVDNW
ncbi:MAG: hypothetical protein LC687_04600 [Actinobacteria bacterium]|nr:hypothetical protein [Actinomycetota bacterium]MCA1807113.1 hypothetical protein [Actinomycetota bacterium]